MLRNALVRVVSRETFSLETCSSTVPAQADAGDGDVPRARLIRSFRADDFGFVLRRRHHEGPDSLKPTPRTTKVVHTVIHRLSWLQHVVCLVTHVQRCHSTGTRAITVFGEGLSSTDPPPKDLSPRQNRGNTRNFEPYCRYETTTDTEQPTRAGYLRRPAAPRRSLRKGRGRPMRCGDDIELSTELSTDDRCEHVHRTAERTASVLRQCFTRNIARSDQLIRNRKTAAEPVDCLGVGRILRGAMPASSPSVMPPHSSDTAGRSKRLHGPTRTVRGTLPGSPHDCFTWNTPCMPNPGNDDVRVCNLRGPVRGLTATSARQTSATRVHHAPTPGTARSHTG